MDSKTLDIKHHWIVLENLIRENGWKFGVEIGLEYGRTFNHLLKTFPGIYMIGVDPFRHMPDAPGEKPYRNMPHERNKTIVKDIAWRYRGRCQVIEKTSKQGSFEVPNDSQDFIFIDGDHSYEGVSEDILLWSPKVRNGGWILGHDYSEYWAGLRKAVDEAFGPHVIEYPCKVWASRKGE